MFWYTAEVVVKCPPLLAWAAMADQESLVTTMSLKPIAESELKLFGDPIKKESYYTLTDFRSDGTKQTETVVLTEMVVAEKLVYDRKKQIAKKIFGVISRVQQSGTRIDVFEFRPAENNCCLLQVTENFSSLSSTMRTRAKESVKAKAALYQRYIESRSQDELWEFARDHITSQGLLPPERPLFNSAKSSTNQSDEPLERRMSSFI